MVWTAGQITTFFEDAAQMGIEHDTVIALNGEGINHPEDLLEFNETALKTIAANFRRPADGGNVVAFSAKAQLRLIAAMSLVKYYNMYLFHFDFPYFRRNRCIHH